jgi:hypothetical protein
MLTTGQPSTVRCSRERLPAAAAQPAKVRQSLYYRPVVLNCIVNDFIIYTLNKYYDNQSKDGAIGRACSTYGRVENGYKILIGKRPHWRPDHGWKNSIIRYLKEKVFDCVDWVHVAQNTQQILAFVTTVKNLRSLYLRAIQNQELSLRSVFSCLLYANICEDKW